VSVGAALFWLATLVLAWVYAGYPLLAWAVARTRPLRLQPQPVPRPTVTVGIAAHNEDAQLEARVADILAQRGDFELEIIVAPDGSSDSSVAILARLAAGDPRVRYLDLERRGQTVAQAEIFAVASGDIVMLSAAETRFEPHCLARLIAPFADPRVGCTTGRIVWASPDQTSTSRSEGVYWRYEQLVRRLESRAGWLTAATGALLAVRRSSYRPVPAYASMDHLLPLFVRDLGGQVIAVEDAVGVDRPITGLHDQFRNRSRTATRGIRANLSMTTRLTPWRHPTAFLAVWSHKLLRWATPLLGLLALGGAAWAAADGQPLYLIPVAFTAVVGGLGVAGLANRRTGTPRRLLDIPAAIVVVNTAFLVGWANVAMGRRIGAWNRTEWAAVGEGTARNAGSR
jgi:cellulose synthase/poly-beta-1,6-N-acetylglucosamine synthase-like glycosyltransferase